MSQSGSSVFSPIGTGAPVSSTVRSRRGWRVVALTVGIAVLSLGDLYITLIYLRSVGMSEANPIARWIMTSSTTGFLIWWKLLSVALGCGIFLYTRRSRSAELGAWLCFAVLIWLTVRWAAYSNEIASLTPILQSLAQADNPRWVVNPN